MTKFIVLCAVQGWYIVRTSTWASALACPHDSTAAALARSSKSKLRAFSLSCSLVSFCLSSWPLASCSLHAASWLAVRWTDLQGKWRLMVTEILLHYNLQARGELPTNPPNFIVHSLKADSKARINKGGLFQIHGLLKSMDWNRREISVSCLCARSKLDLSYCTLGSRLF